MDTITSNEAVTGDILLFHGDSLVSKLIRFFDGTEVNHAAICIGENKLAEAQAQGLAREKGGQCQGVRGGCSHVGRAGLCREPAGGRADPFAPADSQNLGGYRRAAKQGAIGEQWIGNCKDDKESLKSDERLKEG